MSPAMRDRWMTVFASHVPPRRPLAVLDLGCGTGRPESLASSAAEFAARLRLRPFPTFEPARAS